jgi:hypothetical protein
MSAPQMKERPASMLRAMFAGFGSLLSVMDKVRSKSAPSPQTTAPETTEAEPKTTGKAPEAAAEPAAPAATEPPAESPTVTEPAAVTAQEPTAEPVVVVAEVVEPEAVVVETVVAEPETGSALPLVNYDESSVASLRARLRNLSVAQLTQLVEYEKSHADRADVIAMFERRIAKVEAES